jgi:glycosyltransferase involved in cell wall biosynthesis
MDSPELCEKMGNYGIERIKKELAWQVVSEKLLDAYKKLIPKKD